jgi:uncharacterized protein
MSIMRSFISRTFALATLGLLGLSAPATVAQESRSYILATATTGGTYYPVGVALATLVKVKLEPEHGISMSAISSAGSGENVKLLRENQAQFAILQGLFGAYAWNGEGQVEADGKQEYLRSVSMLWQNVEHMVVRNSKAGDGTVGALAEFGGAPFSIGARNSGTEGSGRQMLKGLGIDPEQVFDVVYMGYGPSAEALQNGNIMGMNMPGGVPVTGVTQAFASLGDDITILDYTEEQMAAANGDYGIWTRYVIPANTYPGQSEEVQTVAQPNFLAVRDDVPEEDVYLIVKTMYENLPFLNNIHKATTAMSLDQAVAGMPVPLHPGAVRFYEEQGMEIPAELMPPS